MATVMKIGVKYNSCENKDEYESENRTDTRVVTSLNYKWYTLVKARYYSSDEQNIDAEGIEDVFGDYTYDEVKKIVHAVNGGARMLTHRNKWHSWNDEIRAIKYINPHTYSTPSRNSRKNAMLIDVVGLKKLWTENQEKWHKTYTQIKDKQARRNALTRISSSVRYMNSEIEIFRDRINYLSETPSPTAKDIMDYFIHDNRWKFFSNMYGDDGITLPHIAKREKTYTNIRKILEWWPRGARHTQEPRTWDISVNEFLLAHAEYEALEEKFKGRTDYERLDGWGELYARYVNLHREYMNKVYREMAKLKETLGLGE